MQLPQQPGEGRSDLLGSDPLVCSHPDPDPDPDPLVQQVFILSFVKCQPQMD